MREKFIEKSFSSEALARIAEVNEIIADYQQQGHRLTLRQLYYVLVTRNSIANEKRAYAALGTLLSNARLAGAVDWDAIEDRGRAPFSPRAWPDIAALASDAHASYRLPRWEGQPRYVELWVEKSALAGVLAPLAAESHVTLMVNKGYSSTSAMYDSAKRYIYHCCGADERQCPACKGACACPKCMGEGEHATLAPDMVGEIVACSACEGAGACARCKGSGAINERRKVPFLFYLGDHDPSGEDMVRDIRDRMRMLGVDGIKVYKIALTMKQIERYRPPPNYAKITDPRAAKYVEKYGEHSWEVDALPPAVLAEIIRSAFARVIDRARMDAVLAREEEDKARFRKAVAVLD